MVKIAFPTNDEQNIAQQAGRAKYFKVICVNGDGILKEEVRKNTHHHHDESGDSGEHNHHHNELKETLFDCDYIIAEHMGAHFSKIINEMGIKFKKSDSILIADEIQKYL